MRMLLLITSCAIVIMTTACQNVNRQENYSPVVKETYIHKYGVPVPATDWEARGQEGQVVSQLDNGITVTKNYADGMLNGQTTYSYPHTDAIERIETYVQGTLVKQGVNYRSGPPMQEVQFQPDRSEIITTWYENGSPKSVEHLDSKGLLIEGEYYNTSHQMDARVEHSHGIRIVRNQYGLIASKDTIQDGVMAVHTTFHHNGSPKEITPFKNKLVEGTLKTFNPDGEPNTIEEWSNGRQHGKTIVFLNGEKVTEIPYVNGKKNGIERHYRDGTIVAQEVSWINDLQDGPKTTYIGDVATSEWYFEGQKVSKANYNLRVNASNRQPIQTFPSN